MGTHPDQTADPPAYPGDEQETVTVGRLREVIDHLPADTPLIVGVRDRHHFDALLFDIAIVGVEVTRGPHSPVLVFDAAGIS